MLAYPLSGGFTGGRLAPGRSAYRPLQRVERALARSRRSSPSAASSCSSDALAAVARRRPDAELPERERGHPEEQQPCRKRLMFVVP